MYPQNYGYYPQQPLQNQYLPRTNLIQPASLKGRPVASFEEARAMTIDFDGSIFYFPNAAENQIYTKQINPDGTSAIRTYELINNPSPETVINTNNFVTRDELQKIIEQITTELTALKQNPVAQTNSHPQQEISSQTHNF